MKVDINRGDKEYELLQDFFRYRKEYHHRGDDEDVDSFIDSMYAAGQVLLNKYKGDKNLHRFAGILVMSQIVDAEERDCHNGEKFKLVIKRE